MKVFYEHEKREHNRIAKRPLEPCKSGSKHPLQHCGCRYGFVYAASVDIGHHHLLFIGAVRCGKRIQFFPNILVA